MGLLDDAIREHLELKKRRGSDPTEIERLEREALGPVRRAPQEPADAFTDDEPSPAGFYPDEEDVADWDEPLEESAPFDLASDSAEPAAPGAWSDAEDGLAPRDYESESEPPRDRGYEPPRHHEIAEEWEAHEQGALPAEPAGLEPDAPAPAPPAPAPEEPAPASPPPPAGPVFGEERERPIPRPEFEQETAEYQVEAEELGEEHPSEPGEGDDVLEETPDFLQDTPDHDRLWFEQRPPRDFDFDG